MKNIQFLKIGFFFLVNHSKTPSRSDGV